MTFVCQIQTTTPTEVKQTEWLIKKYPSGFYKGRGSEGKLRNVFMKMIYLSVDLTHCQLYLDLTS